jgi:hypothetical protein
VVGGGGAAGEFAGADGADDGAGGGGGASVLGVGVGGGADDVTVTVSVGGGGGGNWDVGGVVLVISFHPGGWEGVVVVGAARLLVRLGNTNNDTDATSATAARIAATPTTHGQRGGVGGEASYSAAGSYVS